MGWGGAIFRCFADHVANAGLGFSKSRECSSEVHAATLKALGRTRVFSLTNDHGLEFSAFKKTAKALGAPVFFVRPYASWERGSIENMSPLDLSHLK
jgi:IS30 family transposase